MIVCNKPRGRLLTLLSLLVALVISTVATAQEEERWYRVELLIFTHQSETAQTSEHWEATPELHYPQQFRFLVDPTLVEQNLTLVDATSAVDERGHQTLTVIPPAAERGTAAALEHTVVEQTAGEVKSDPAAEGDLATTPSPFVQLPNSELEFRGKAAYMQRTGRYRTLFHETWVQPILELSRTLPIVIDRSGDAEDWPQLQGSVKLYLSRYLHLETNLWLNTAGHYLPPGWKMPAAPLGPESLTIIYPPEPEPKVAAARQAEPIDSGFFRGTSLEPMGPVYPWRHAVSLQQERRMRSTEVHYIDHPLLGVVVKVSPLSAEELQQRAEAEMAQSEDEALNK